MSDNHTGGNTVRRTITALALSATLAGCTPATDPAPTPDVSRETSTAAPTSTPPTSSPTPAPSTAPPTQELYPVTRVVDGDTFYVDMDGTQVGVRIIGMDTPETVHPTQPVECYGPEASAAAKNRLEGQRVALIQDPTQGTLDPDTGLRTDYYDRALFYVELADGTDYGLSMIQDGLAEEYTYRRQTYERQDTYVEAEALARETGEGQWANC